VIERLGIAEEVRRKPTSATPMWARVAARGETEMAVQQISELLPVAGIDIVGPLPGELQKISVFAAGVFAAARNPDGANKLIAYLAEPALAPVANPQRSRTRSAHRVMRVTPAAHTVTCVTLLWLAGNGMRMTILAVPPLIPLIHSDLHMSETEVGILAGLPVVLFAIAAVPGSLLIARFGAVATVIAGLLITALGSALRGAAPNVLALYAATS